MGTSFKFERKNPQTAKKDVIVRWLVGERKFYLLRREGEKGETYVEI